MTRPPRNSVLRLRRAPESGISLVELIVSMVLLGLVSSIAVGLFVSATRTIAMASATHEDTGTAANIMNELTQVIRSGTANPVSDAASAPAVITATPKKLVMYTYADSDAALPRPLKVEFTRSDASGQLVEKRWAPSVTTKGFWNFASPTLISTRTFPGVLRNTNLFTYNTADGRSSGAPDAAKVPSITSISVLVVIRDDTNASGVRLENTVGMPNLGLSKKETP